MRENSKEQLNTLRNNLNIAEKNSRRNCWLSHAPFHIKEGVHLNYYAYMREIITDLYTIFNKITALAQGQHLIRIHHS